MFKNERVDFYAVWGTNGVGVVTSWSRVLKNQKFLKHNNCQKFDNWDDAEAKALEEYNALNPHDPFFGPLRCNYILFSSQLKNENGFSALC